MTIPPKLQPGDEVRIISPATSLGVLSDELRALAIERLEDLGLRVSFGENAAVLDEFDSSPAEARVADLHWAFADPNVKGILTTLGGFNSNSLLHHLDYDLIRANPKVLCGYSDITALASAIYARTGLVTYSGPHFSTFGMRHGLEYTLEYFQKCLLQAEPFEAQPAPHWSDDPWFRDQEARTFEQPAGWQAFNPGQAAGRLLGGNLCTLNLLQGTPYMPDLHGSLLLVEDDYESQPLTFERDLQSLLHLPGFAGVTGLIVGRFQRGSHMTAEKLGKILGSRPELSAIPVVSGASFGHTSPIFTFPIGGYGELLVSEGEIRFTIREH